MIKPQEWRESAAISLCKQAVEDIKRCGYVNGTTVEKMKRLIETPVGEEKLPVAAERGTRS